MSRRGFRGSRVPVHEELPRREHLARDDRDARGTRAWTSCSKPSATGGGVDARRATSTDAEPEAPDGRRAPRRRRQAQAGGKRIQSRRALRPAPRLAARSLRRPPRARGRDRRCPCPTRRRAGPHARRRAGPGRRARAPARQIPRRARSRIADRQRIPVGLGSTPTPGRLRCRSTWTPSDSRHQSLPCSCHQSGSVDWSQRRSNPRLRAPFRPRVRAQGARGGRNPRRSGAPPPGTATTSASVPSGARSRRRPRRRRRGPPRWPHRSAGGPRGGRCARSSVGWTKARSTREP